jgi:hypothetical protein
MANALEGEHKNAEAVKEYVKAISVNPKMGDSFYRIATLYLKEQHQAQARVMFAKAVVLGPEAEYIRDAKKQLSALDATFAGDVADRRETRTSVGPSTAPAKDAGASTESRPKPEQRKTAPTVGGTDNLKLRPKAAAPETAAPPKPSINIKTDANGIGVVTDEDTEKPKKKKKEKEKKAHKKAEKKESDVAEIQQAPLATPTKEETRSAAARKKSPAASTSATAPAASSSPEPASAQPDAGSSTGETTAASPANATDLTGMTDTKPVKQKKMKAAKVKVAKVAKVKKPKRDKFNNPEDLAKSFIVQPPEEEVKDATNTGTAPLNTQTESNSPAGSSMAQPAEPAERTEMPVPTSDSAATTNSAPTATPLTPNNENTTTAPANQSPSAAAEPATPATSATPVAPVETATPDAPAASQPAVEPTADSSPSNKAKHKHVLRKKHESTESQAVINTAEPDTGQLSDLKEKPLNSAPPTNTDTVPGQ